MTEIYGARMFAEATAEDLHADVPLSNLAVTAFNEPSAGLIGPQIFPATTVGKESDRYYVIDKGAFLRVPRADRARRTSARRLTFDISSDSYFADNYALAAETALEDISNADMAIQLRQNSVRQITGLLQLAQEERIASIVTSASNVGSGVTLNANQAWNVPTSDPIGHVNTGQAFIQNNTGLLPNLMAMSWNTFKAVRRHPAILDLFKHTRAGELTAAELAGVFEVDQLLVGRAIKHNEPEGAATASVTNVWGNNILLAHVEPSMGMQTRTLGLRFQWQPGTFPAAFGVLGPRQEAGAGQRKVEIIEAGHYQDEKIVATDLGYVIASAVQ